MKKTIWIARIADDNSDAYRAFFTESEAAAQAAGYADHLTAKERNTQTVSVESYPVEVTAGDDRTAEQLYRDLVNEDDEQIMNPDVYKEV